MSLRNVWYMLIASKIHTTTATSDEGNQRATGEEGVVSERQINMKALIRLTNQKIEKEFQKKRSPLQNRMSQHLAGEKFEALFD